MKTIIKTEIKSPEKVKIDKPSIIFDTLVFHESMNTISLREKYEAGKSEFEFYKKFITSEEIDKLKTIKEDNDITDIKYLGELKDLDNQNSYHIITNFKVVGTDRLAPRGYSEVAFINLKSNKILVYNLSMPYELPQYLSQNILYFEIDKTKYGISIQGGLPPLFCIPENGCY